MALKDSLASLFKTGKRKMRDLSSSVVRHDRFDDGVLEDFTERATRFKHALDDPPLTPKVRMPDLSDFDDPRDYQAALEEAEKRQVDADIAAEGYAGWSHDVKDVFRSYHTWEEPSTLAQSEIKPSRELGREIMQRLILSDAFTDSRPMTRHSDIESGLATMTFTDRLKQELETTLAEHVEKSQEASEQESRIDAADQALDRMREQAKKQKAEQGAVDPNLVSDIKEQVQQRQQARGALQQAAQAIVSMGTEQIADAVDAAAEEAEEAAEALSMMPGSEMGQQSNITPEQAFALAQKWRENPRLKKIAELTGRFKKAMKYERAKRIQGGREEVVDFEPGGDLSLVLPHELALLAHPVLKVDFIRRWLDRSLLQYEMVGEDNAGHGPAVCLLDGSGSMTADFGGVTRNEWARSLGLATLSIMHAEKRDVCLIEYGSGKNELKSWWFPKDQPIDPDEVADFASHMFGGGTDITASLVRTREIMDDSPVFKQADVILMTDGEDQWGEDDDEITASLKARGVRVQGISIALGVTHYLTQGCDVVTPVMDLAHGSDDALEMVATSLT